MAKHTFNLIDYKYDDVRELTDDFINQEVTFNNEEKSFKAILVPNAFIRDYTPTNKTRFYNSGDDNLISVTINEAYATLQYKIGEIHYATVAYRDETVHAKIAKFYAGNLPDAVKDTVTLSPSQSVVRVNLTAAIQANPEKAYYKYLEIPEEEVKEEEKEGPATKGQLIMLHTVIDRSHRPMDHEVEWQIDNIGKSLNFLTGTGLGMYRHDGEYDGSDDPDSTLQNFRNWVIANKANAGYDIYFLIRWGGWSGGTLGEAYLNSYNVNTNSHPWAYGISSSTCLYPWVFAHEMGHILGATHVNDNGDIMYPTSVITCTGRHRNLSNINIIKQNGIYRP